MGQQMLAASLKKLLDNLPPRPHMDTAHLFGGRTEISHYGRMLFAEIITEALESCQVA